MILRLLVLLGVVTCLYLFLKPANPHQQVTLERMKVRNMAAASAALDYADQKVHQGEVGIHKTAQNLEKVRAKERNFVTNLKKKQAASSRKSTDSPHK